MKRSLSLTLASLIAPLNGMATRGCRSNPSSVFSSRKPSQIEYVLVVHAFLMRPPTLGKSTPLRKCTRSPVSWRLSFTVKALLGKMLAPKWSPRTTPTGFAAAAAGAMATAAAVQATAVASPIVRIRHDDRQSGRWPRRSRRVSLGR